MNYDEITQMLDELEVAAQYEGTELGEYWAALVHIGRHIYSASDQFREAFEQELVGQYNWFKENFEFVTVTESYTRDVKELVWKNE